MASLLWQILLKIQGSSTHVNLTCDECFELLDYLTSQISAEETYLDSLYDAARKHLQYCADCREHHLKLLQDLESSYLAYHKNGRPRAVPINNNAQMAPGCEK
jgi:hypothetical protein